MAGLGLPLRNEVPVGALGLLRDRHLLVAQRLHVVSIGGAAPVCLIFIGRPACELERSQLCERNQGRTRPEVVGLLGQEMPDQDCPACGRSRPRRSARRARLRVRLHRATQPHEPPGRAGRALDRAAGPAPTSCWPPSWPRRSAQPSLLLLTIAFLSARLFGLSLSGWRAVAPLPPLPGALLLVAVAGALFPHLLLAGTLADFDGLLVSVPRPTDPASLLLPMLHPDEVLIQRTGLFGTLVLALALLVLVLQRQAAARPGERAGIAGGGVAVALAGGALRQTRGPPGRGGPHARVRSGVVPVIRLSGGSANVVRRHFCGAPVSQEICPTGASAGQALSLWTLAAAACIAVAGLVAFAERPTAAAGPPTTVGAADVPPAAQSPAAGDAAASPPPAAGPAESDWLIEFFPLLAEHTQQVIALFANIIELMARGDEELGAALPLTAAAGDVWRYDLGSATARRITSDGGYATPLPAPGDGRIAVIHEGALALLDPAAGSRRAIDDTSDYARVLAWSADRTELLALTRQGELRRVRVEDGGSRRGALDTDRHPLARNAALTALPRVTAGLAYLRTQPAGDASWIVRDRPDFDFAQPVFKFEGHAHDPAESADGTTIFFIGERS